jgi:hypothetical protein
MLISPLNWGASLNNLSNNKREETKPEKFELRFLLMHHRLHYLLMLLSCNQKLKKKEEKKDY